jgi:hypothetical protein
MHPRDLFAEAVVAEADDPGASTTQGERSGKIVEDLGNIDGHAIVTARDASRRFFPGRVYQEGPRAPVLAVPVTSIEPIPRKSLENWE